LDCVPQSRLKNATLAVLRKESEVGGQELAASEQEGPPVLSLPREQRQQLTERDSCVGELGTQRRKRVRVER
jgi:hypothetical protein